MGLAESRERERQTETERETDRKKNLLKTLWGKGENAGNQHFFVYHGLFLHEQLAHLHTGITEKNVSNVASDEDIMENNHKFVMIWNLRVISHLIFPECFLFFLISCTKIYE